MEDKNYKLYLKANKLISNKRFYDAINILSKLYEREPDNIDIMYNYAKCLIKLNKKTDLTRNILLKLTNSKYSRNALYELGILEKNNNNLIEAKNYLTKIINSPLKNNVILELGRIEKELNNYNDAKKYFYILLNTNLKLIAYIELGKLERKFKNINEARNYFKYLLNTDNRNIAIFELGILEKEIGNYDNAIEYFKELLNTNEKYYAMYELGLIYKEIGSIELAEFYFNEGINANNKAKYNSLYELAKIEKDINKSLEYHNIIIKSNTYFTSYSLYEVILINIKQEKYIEALKLIEKLINKYPNFNKHQVNNTYYYIKYKLNLLNKEDIENTYYYGKQLINYNELDALDHIEKHLDENNKKYIHSIFLENIDILNLYYIIQNEINKINPEESTIVDIYTIELNNPIGYYNNIETNTLKIVTIPNTKNILSIYPTIIKNKVKNHII